MLELVEDFDNLNRQLNTWKLVHEILAVSFEKRTDAVSRVILPRRPWWI